MPPGDLTTTKPTGDRVAQLPAERRAALERLVAQAAARRGAARVPALTARPDPGQPAPLSYSQERLWYMEQLFQRRDIFAFPAAARLRGGLDVDALARALPLVVRRHETLRTTFETAAGEIVQRVHPDPPLDLEVVALGGPRECAEVAGLDVRRGFDLTATPPLRTRLYRLAPDDHVLVVNQHVAVADVPSRIILLDELWAHYSHLTGGPPPALPTLPIQYADFAIWQRDWLQGERLDRLVRYWTDRLEGAPHKLALPSDRPRPLRHAGSGRFLYTAAPARLAPLVGTSARRLRTTASVLLLALYRALLWHHTSQEDFVIGVPKGERAQPETEHVIGYFINVLPLRSPVRGGDTVRELVAREHERALSAYAHQALPYERVVQALNPVREPGVPPLYQVSYSYVPAGVQDPPLAPAGLQGEAFPVASEGTEYDLGINLTHGRDELRAQWPYNDEIFDEATVAALAERYWTLVGAALSDVDGRVATLPALTQTEQRRGIPRPAAADGQRPVPAAGSGGPARGAAGRAGGAAAATDPVGSVAQRVRDRAARAPAATAVRDSRTSLSYRDLDTAADRLAGRLAAQQLPPGSTVTVALPRTVDLPVAVLAVWRAGHCAALSPVPAPDPFPGAARVDAGPDGLTVTGASRRPDPPHPDRPLVGAAPAGPNPDGAALRLPADGGGPVTVSHRALAAATRDLVDRIGSVASMVTSAGDDPLLLSLQLFVPWWCGGTTIVTPAAGAGSPLAELLAARRPSHAAAPAAQWRAALAAGWPGDRDLTAVCVGDGPHPTLATNLSQATAAVWHCLLRPEAAGAVVGHPVVAPAGDRVLLGRPVGDLRGYVRDPEGLRPVPDGVLGELCLAGDRLAGCWPASAATAADRLRPDPYAPTPGARLLRTGELVRRRGDGEMEWYGPLADRVTVQGLPVLLGELRQLIAGCPGVADALVVARPAGGEAGIAAYVQPAGELDRGALRSWLERRLPAFLVPTLTMLAELPRRPDGRADVATLPDPGSGPDPDGSVVAAAGPVARAIAEVWSILLDVTSPLANANFFELGGHSLMLAELSNRLSARFQVTPAVPIVELLERPTIAEQALLIDALVPGGS